MPGVSELARGKRAGDGEKKTVKRVGKQEKQKKQLFKMV